MTTEVAKDPSAPAPGSARRKSRKPPRRRPVKRSTIWLHRWLSLVLGLLLLVETTTGALLVYRPEIERQLRSDAYAPAVERGQGQSLHESMATAHEFDPDFTSTYAYDDRGTHLVSDDSGRTITVDPSSGEVLGEFNVAEPPPGALGWTLALAYNIHLCGLTCEGYPGYAEWALEEVPGMDWAGFHEGDEVYPITWGGLLLGITAVLLLFLGLSGIWLWWPTFRRFSRGVRLRWRKGRYARDYDLHQVVGMIALPFILMWALTGMSYEFGFVEKGWYAALPGDAEESALTVEESSTEIEYDAALASAQAAAGTTAEPTLYSPPVPDDPLGYYDFWFSIGFDPWEAGAYAGDTEVQVDRHDASNAVVTYGVAGQPTAQTIYQDYNYPVHSGFFVNGWVRILWLVFGLVPLLLAWTGVSTWLWKRAVRKRRRRGDLARAAG